MSDEKIEFKAPQGVVPEDVEVGGTFDLVSTYRLKPSGEICLIQIGEHKMPGYDEDDYNEKASVHREGYGDVMSSMHSAMSANGGGPGNTDTGGY